MPASKASCRVNRHGGSNPSLSAIFFTPAHVAGVCMYRSSRRPASAWSAAADRLDSDEPTARHEDHEDHKDHENLMWFLCGLRDLRGLWAAAVGPSQSLVVRGFRPIAQIQPAFDVCTSISV